jgi:hypothetical protein
MKGKGERERRGREKTGRERRGKNYSHKRPLENTREKREGEDLNPIPLVPRPRGTTTPVAPALAVTNLFFLLD